MQGEVIQIVLPVALKEVFDTLTPDFIAKTGYRFEVALMLNPEVPGYIETGAAWSVALSNPEHIQKIVAQGRCQGGVQDLGYSPLCFAMRGEPSAPATEAPEEIAAFLRGVETIAITTSGTSSKQFAQLTAELGITDDVKEKLRWMPGGEPAAAALRGEVDTAILPQSNIEAVPGIYAKAICPRDMDVQVDLALCLAKGANRATQDFAKWLLDPTLCQALHDLGVRSNGSID